MSEYMGEDRRMDGKMDGYRCINIRKSMWTDE